MGGPLHQSFSPTPPILQALSPTLSRSVPMYVPMYVILLYLIHVVQAHFLPQQGLSILTYVMIRLDTNYWCRIVEERWGLNFGDKSYLARNLPHCFLLNSGSHPGNESSLSSSVLDREVNLISKTAPLRQVSLHF